MMIAHGKGLDAMGGPKEDEASQLHHLGSDLLDLSGCSLEELRSKDRDLLARSADRVLQQVRRPRGNYGGSGPPGRVD